MKLTNLQEARTLQDSAHMMGFIKGLIRDLENDPVSDQATDFHVDYGERKQLENTLRRDFKTNYEEREDEEGPYRAPWWYIGGDWILTFRDNKVEIFSERWKDYWDFDIY